MSAPFCIFGILFAGLESATGFYQRLSLLFFSADSSIDSEHPYYIANMQ
jgi:hypothetical protein